MTPKHVTQHALWVAAAVFLATVLLAPVWNEANVSVTSGTVELGRGEPPVWTAAEPGDALGAGDRVRTGADGRAELALGDSTLRLYPNSLLRLPAPGPDAAAVELDSGSSLFDVLRRGERFEIHTPEVVVSVKGTRFGVEVGGDDASVSVFRGLVGVREGTLPGAGEILVQEGFAALGSDHLELIWHGADDPWEGWADGMPLPELGAGHSARRDAMLRDARAAALKVSQERMPAARDPEGGRGEGRRDKPGPSSADTSNGVPIRDALTKPIKHIDKALEESFIEEVVNPTAGPSTPVDELLQIVFVDGSGRPGPDVVQVLHGGVTWSFDEDAVEEIEEGDDQFPPNLLTLIQAQGLTEQQMARQLSRLFGGGDDDD